MAKSSGGGGRGTYSGIRAARRGIMSQAEGLPGLYVSRTGAQYYATRRGDNVTVRYGSQSRRMSVERFAQGLVR